MQAKVGRRLAWAGEQLNVATMSLIFPLVSIVLLMGVSPLATTLPQQLVRRRDEHLVSAAQLGMSEEDLISMSPSSN